MALLRASARANSALLAAACATRGAGARVTIVGLAGPSAAGKSTLASALQRMAPLRVVCLDEHFLPHDECPRVDLGALAWPTGRVPAAFEERGDADLNDPRAVDWPAVEAAITAAVAEAERAGGGASVLVEGQLLFAEHPGAARVLARCVHCACLCADGADDEAMAALWTRKWSRRGHLGKGTSYRERGVNASAYEVYWRGAVWPSWRANGIVPERALHISALLPTAEQADVLRGAGWLDASEAEPAAAHA